VISHLACRIFGLRFLVFSFFCTKKRLAESASLFGVYTNLLLICTAEPHQNDDDDGSYADLLFSFVRKS